MEKKKVDSIVHAEYVLPMDDKFAVIHGGAIAVNNGKIEAVGKYEEIKKDYYSENIIGGKGRAVFPGLINTHTHAAMVYFRGIADDLPLKEWLENHIWPAEGKWLSPEFINDAVGLACLEMLKAGITTYNDMYFFEDAAGRATKKLGMRAVLGVGILDFPTAAAKTADEYFEKAEVFIKDWKGDELITPCIAPHALYTCGPDTLKRARRAAERYDIPIHIHLSETRWEVDEIKNRYGRTPVEHLEDLGFLDERVLAAHCVWLTDREIEILAKRNAGVSHCVESNLKLASGIAPVVKMLKAKVKVTFGTDGAASNNDLNILSEMSTAAKLHKAHSEDPTALDDRTALLMATRWGADVLGLGDKIGSLEKGKRADITIVNLEKPHLTPLYDIYSHIVYSMRPSDVETVIVDGRVVINDGELQTTDETEIMEKAKKWQGKIK
ncbi:MAG: amidohydrolase family protein [Nitrospirae bacterium]|nr:amidohydrolase family protein [Nitrospirota bacterium]